MTYKDTLDWLFTQLPAFHKVGAGAYKPGLDRVLALSNLFGNPHSGLKCIHIAGTNGKGSTAHTLAAILQSQGYKVGLFTSPHLVDFRERIRVNGEMIAEDDVVDFVVKAKDLASNLGPSFFELTAVMAFDYFRKRGVDYAVIEVGLGGRLDSTNIITPLLSVITNISLDHTSLLGSTEVEIAGEKAGIIKREVPVVIGESSGDVRERFLSKATGLDAPIIFADDSDEIISVKDFPGYLLYETRHFGAFKGDLTGTYQQANARTILSAVAELRHNGLDISDKSVASGFANVCKLTGLFGRWSQLADNPLTICDTGHNSGGWRFISRQLASIGVRKHIIVGFVNDKDVESVLSMLADVHDVCYYFTQPETPRKLPAAELCAKAAQHGISGGCFETVDAAYKAALADIADKSREMIFIGGSNFVVADLLTSMR